MTRDELAYCASRVTAFWAGVVCGADDRASMAKVMTWVVLTAMLVTWFTNDRSIEPLEMVFAGLLAYTTVGKYRNYGYTDDQSKLSKSRRQHGKDRGDTSSSGRDESGAGLREAGTSERIQGNNGTED